MTLSREALSITYIGAGLIKAGGRVQRLGGGFLIWCFIRRFLSAGFILFQRLRSSFLRFGGRCWNHCLRSRNILCFSGGNCLNCLIRFRNFLRCSGGSFSQRDRFFRAFCRCLGGMDNHLEAPERSKCCFFAGSWSQSAWAGCRIFCCAGLRSSHAILSSSDRATPCQQSNKSIGNMRLRRFNETP